MTKFHPVYTYPTLMKLDYTRICLKSKIFSFIEGGIFNLSKFHYLMDARVMLENIQIFTNACYKHKQCVFVCSTNIRFNYHNVLIFTDMKLIKKYCRIILHGLDS